MKKLLLPSLLIISQLAASQNNPPILSNVQVSLLNANTLSISYDLADAESDPVTVSLRAGASGANVLDFTTDNSTGDVGAGISPGTGKQITWDFSAYSGTAMDEFRLMLVADDLHPVDIQQLVDMVDSARLISDLSFIEGVRHRTAGAAHLQETKDFLTSQYLDHGLQTYTQDFTYGNYNAQNIIGRQPGTGTTGDTYIVGGHFDTVADAPGADDNGSAVVGVLEAMRVLTQYPTKKALKFINFDLEEVGLVGSNRYVSNGIGNGEVVAGMIDFEMIGYYTEVPNTQSFPFGFNLLFPDAYNEVGSQQNKGNFITNVGRMGNSSPLMQQYKTSSATYVPALRVVNVESPVAFPSDLGRSDHAPFWVAGKPAIMLTDGAEFRNPNYHTPGDSLGTINFTFMANVVKGTAATLAELAEVQHADVWWADTDLFTPTQESFGCGVKISPNPAHGHILVDWTGCDANIQQLTLLDGMGKTVASARPLGSQYEMNIEKLAAGTYFLRMENATGTKTMQVVVE